MNRRLSILLIILGASSAKAQYTDQINSNRPGSSIGAFSVGKNVIQAEAGLALRNFTHAGYNNSTFRGSISFLSIRWGFLFETLELTYEGQFLSGTLNSKILTNATVYSRNGFLQNFIGLKYLLYDPFKKEKELNGYILFIDFICSSLKMKSGHHITRVSQSNSMHTMLKSFFNNSRDLGCGLKNGILRVVMQMCKA